MLLTILSLVACGVVAWMIACVKMKTNKMAELSEKLPGPKALPVLGNVLDFGGLKLNSGAKDFFDASINISNQYGTLYRMWLGPYLFITVLDPRYIEAILSSSTQLDKSVTYKFLLPWIGRGLLTSTGQKWKKHRRIITPTFHSKILESFVEVFHFNARKMIEKLRKEVDGPEFDVSLYISLCTLDIIAETAMGISIGAQDNDQADFVRATRNIANIAMSSTFKILHYWDPLFQLLPTAKLQKESLRVLHALSTQVVKTRRAEQLNKAKMNAKSRNGNSVDYNDVGAKKHRVFLDMLLEVTEEGSVLTDEEIREEVDTFMYEGHDTTTSGISFTLSSLSLHSDIQEKAYQEQEAIFGSSDREATHQDLQEMKYLEQVIKETQRLFPSVPVYGRTLTHDLKLGEYTLPEGADVLISPLIMQRRGALFTNPEKFDPERFSPENSKGHHPYQYIPFSAGPRNCIGKRFAMLEMKSVASKMLRNFKMLPGSTTNKLDELTAELVLKNVHGIKLRLVERK